MAEVVNLDRMAARCAQSIVGGDGAAKPLETLVTKTLGVLQEQGVYAAFLYLHTRTQRTEQGVAERIRERSCRLIAEALPGLTGRPGSSAAEQLAFVSEHVMQDLDRLLLVKDLLEQTLIYTRYGAKAAGAVEDASRPKGANDG